jgi:hypothetical protein
MWTGGAEDFARTENMKKGAAKAAQRIKRPPAHRNERGESRGAVVELGTFQGFIELEDAATYIALSKLNLGPKYFILIDGSIIGGFWHVTLKVEPSCDLTWDVRRGVWVLASHMVGISDGKDDNIAGCSWIDHTVSRKSRDASVKITAPAGFTRAFIYDDPPNTAGNVRNEEEAVTRALPDAAKVLRFRIAEMQPGPIDFAYVNAPESLRHKLGDWTRSSSKPAGSNMSWAFARTNFEDLMKQSIDSLIEALFKQTAMGESRGAFLGFQAPTHFARLTSDKEKERKRLEERARTFTPEWAISQLRNWQSDNVLSLMRIATVFAEPSAAKTPPPKKGGATHGQVGEI